MGNFKQIFMPWPWPTVLAMAMLVVSVPTASIAAADALEVEPASDEASPADGDEDDALVDIGLPSPAAFPARAQMAPDESIYVVQERVYTKRGKIEIEPHFFTKVNPKFVGYLGLGISAAYHIRENFAVEVLTSVPYAMQPFYSDLVFEVFEYESLTPEDVDMKLMTYFNAVSVQFSALYGKASFYRWLIDYDLYVNAGVGAAKLDTTCTPSTALEQRDCSTVFDAGRGRKEPSVWTDRWKLTGNVGLGSRFFFSDMFGLRLELRDIVYSDRDTSFNEITTDIRDNMMFFLGMIVAI